MKKYINKKNIIIGAIILVSIFLVIGGIFMLRGSKSKLDYENDVTIENIKIHHVKVEESNGLYTYKAEITAYEETDIRSIDITVKNDKDEEIITLLGYVGKKLEKNESYNIQASTDKDISTISKVSYVINKQ